jgi:hypothetical protein
LQKAGHSSQLLTQTHNNQPGRSSLEHSLKCLVRISEVSTFTSSYLPSLHCDDM